jgi:hypothetical protein
MDTLDLPLVLQSDSLEATLQRMRTANARAVVIEISPDVHRLVMNTDLVQAHVQGKQLLKDLGIAGQSVVRISTIREHWENELDLAGASFGVVPSDASLIRLVTRHEGLAAEIRLATKICRCSKNSDHMAESPPAKDGGKCDYGDGHYVCY